MVADAERSVAGQRVLVLGASSGIGRELARALVAQGALVAGAARRLDRLSELEGVLPVRCDAADPGQVEATVAAAVEGLGGLDAVIYAAGMTDVTPVATCTIDDWQRIYAINIFGPVMLARYALAHLQAPTSQGRMVFLTSDSAYKPYPGMLPYATSKAALAAFAAGLADEVGLRVSEVVVGPTGGTEAAANVDPAAFGDWVGRWFDEGFIRFGMLQPEDVVTTIIEILVAEQPARQVWATGEPTIDQTIEELGTPVPGEAAAAS